MGYSHNKYKTRVVDISFQDLKKKKSNTSTITNTNTASITSANTRTGTEIYNPNIYVSAQSYMNGPWPTNCEERYVINGVSCEQEEHLTHM